jgi:tRNA-dihydrouridine synthase B
MKVPLKKIKIGDISLKNNLFLAPMEGFTNVSFRKNITEYKVGMLFTEMIPAIPLGKHRNYCKHLLYRDKLEDKTTYQLFGNKPEDFIKATKNIEDVANMININLGCPAENIISQGAGSALLLRKNRVYDIVKKLKKSTSLPISIKIRTGYAEPSHFDYEKLFSFGCDAVFIHARTGKQKYSGDIDINFLKEAKERSPEGLKIIGNGDINKLSDILEMYEKTKVDGFMIGRACLHNPRVFLDLLSGKDCIEWENTMKISEKINFLEKYYEGLEEYDINGKITKTRILSLFLFRKIKNAKKIRIELAKAKEKNKIFSILSNIGD